MVGGRWSFSPLRAALAFLIIIYVSFNFPFRKFTVAEVIPPLNCLHGEPQSSLFFSHSHWRAVEGRLHCVGGPFELQYIVLKTHERFDTSLRLPTTELFIFLLLLKIWKISSIQQQEKNAFICSDWAHRSLHTHVVVRCSHAEFMNSSAVVRITPAHMTYTEENPKCHCGCNSSGGGRKKGAKKWEKWANEWGWKM